MNIAEAAARHAMSPSPAAFSELPPELIVKIAGGLDARSLSSLRQTNRRVASIARDAVRTVSPDSVQNVAAAARAFPNAMKLDLSRTREVKTEDAELLLNSPRLTDVDVRGCYRLTPTFARSLIRARNVTRIKLGYSALATNGTLQALFALRRLHELDVRLSSQIDDRAFTNLPADSELASLTLSACPHIGDGGIRELAALPKLRHLDLSNCTQLDGPQLQAYFAERRPELELHTAGCIGVKPDPDSDSDSF